jgi:prepilin-type processing-associated H-X9-DG protein
LKQVGLALESYAIQHGGFPQASNWSDSLLPYFTHRDVLKCPSTPKRPPGDCHYAYNRKLSALPYSAPGLAVSGATAELVAVVDGLPGWNRSAYKSADARHYGGANVLFLDGHLKWVREEEIPKLRWDVPHAVPGR